jgi:hypothetical protein
MQHLTKLPLPKALEDSSIRNSILEITQESYSNPSVLLEQEFEKNNEIYMSFSSDERLDAFFMVGWSKLLLNARYVDCVFLGLSAVRAERKGGSLAVRLYRAFFSDADAVSMSSGLPVAWWFHTASPIVAGVMWRIASDIGPRMDGHLSISQQQLLTSIQAKHDFTRHRDVEIPFVLRGIAKARYAPLEVARLDSRRARQESPLEKWRVDEAAGDRALFVGQCSPPSGN